MDEQPYSPPPAVERKTAPPTGLPARPVAAAVLALVLAAGLGGYRLGRKAPPPVLTPLAAAPSAAPSAPAPQPQTAKEFSEVDLGSERNAQLVPYEQEKDSVESDEVEFKRGVIHLGGRKASSRAGRPWDIVVDGQPTRVYLQPSPTDPRAEEAVIRVKGRHRPHVVDWGGSETRWDGQTMTWLRK